jgi:hypothetical protein
MFDAELVTQIKLLTPIVRPLKPKQGDALPYCTYRLIDTDETHHTSGEEVDEFFRVRYLSTTYTDARTTGQAIYDALNGYTSSGTVGAYCSGLATGLEVTRDGTDEDTYVSSFIVRVLL